MPPETHSTAQAEQLDNLCDAILQRLRFLREAQTLVQLADALDAQIGSTEDACERLVRADLLRAGTVGFRQGGNPLNYFRAYWLPEDECKVAFIGQPKASPPCATPHAPAPEPCPKRYFELTRNPADIAEAAAVNLCVRQDLERQGASADVLAALTAAATALSGLLLADLRKRQVLA